MLGLALACILVCGLYLPAAHPQSRFLDELHEEHVRNIAFWGPDHANATLARTLALYAAREQLAPAAFSSSPSVVPSADTAAAAQQMSEVVQRLFHNSYARGFDAMLLLAAYRACLLAQWLPWLSAMMLLACFDACMLRQIRSKEFLEHRPVRLVLCLTGAVLALALTVLLLFTPASIGPVAQALAPLAFGILLARAVGHLPG